MAQSYMPVRHRPLLVSLLAFALSGVVTTAAAKFTSTWGAPEARTLDFKGKKVAALVISEDLSLRMSGEEALARELTARGIEGTAAYRQIPAPELKNPDAAKQWFARDNVAGVVALKPVSQDKVKRYTPDVWASPYYSTLWGFYPYSWSTVYVVGGATTDTVVVVESLIYDVPSGKLMWAGVSESTNPKTLQKLVADIVKEAAKKIEKQFR
jgi:hypothetical protein